MVAVLTVLLVLTISLVVVRVATVSLVMTGISKDLAQFQALSAFTGAGFTTRESEDIVNHPVRRRIVMHLMLMGHAGAVIAVASVLLSFLNVGRTEDWMDSRGVRALALLVGVIVFWLLASSRHVEELMWRANSWTVQNWLHIDVRDYNRLLRLGHDFVVSELAVQEGDWLADQTLADAQLSREGVLVLGIERSDGTYVGAPRGHNRICAGDCLILYARQEALTDLDERSADIVGNMKHVIAVTRQLDELDREEASDQGFPKESEGDWTSER